ncbi:DNA translocase FtsK [Candidatus Roizmanbacteria bacterium CG03_land_8_20_14_0_80_39_12]|uniref:DNA translocase FtsK n=2 Tax=Candidatus Roizmaniibacteriota TaxID=1752723 RepID=A0A2M7BS70_9BACT|nr:MAG: DNA translocase FtsK [Candidatus Roizmanbacteria bacterium CG03_land_8_20_14_0_80_39_12]
MARKKSKIKIPFIKAKVNARTVFLLFGLILLLAGLLLLLSLLPLGERIDGRLLSVIRQFLAERFGMVAFFVPTLIILSAVHAITHSKKQLLRPTITIGLFFIFLSLGGLFKGGVWGLSFYNLLQDNISLIGATFFFLTLLGIGIILFLDTSIDVIFSGLVGGIVILFKSLKASIDPALQRIKTSDKKSNFITDKKMDGKKSYIEDKKAKETLLDKKNGEKQQFVQSEITKTQVNQDLYIKPLTQSGSTWIFPPLNLLSNVKQAEADRGDVHYIADTIEKTLDSFGISARVAEQNKGPAVTQYGIEIKSGTRLSRITALANDLALAIAAPTGQVRIEAPIPGRAMVGIEIPNIRSQIVTLKSLLEADIFTKNPDPLLMPLGLDVSGKPVATSIGKMPHCLIAGTTGSGKSVIINAWISTMLFRTRPEELRLILVDPKRVEMSQYNNIPHLLTPVINEPEVTLRALRWTVNEMQERYKQFAAVHARNLDSYNLIPGIEKKPYIIFMIDELADLMMFAGNDVESLITRIAQLARATGIHLVLATQRPSVDVITGLMKANIPARLAFNVSSMIDSRVIIDMPGAEKLLGKGDMLFLPPDQAKPRRIQGPFITEREVTELTKFIRAQSPEVHYTEEIMETDPGITVGGIPGMPGSTDGKDALFNQALEIVIQSGKASTSFLQRKLKIGYSRAAAIIDEMEAAGYIGAATGSGKPREILKRTPSSDVLPEEPM